MDSIKFATLLHKLESFVVGLENSNQSQAPEAMMKKFESLVARAEAAQPGAGQ